MEASENKKEYSLKIRLDEEIAQGKYSNFVLVNHTDSEFILDFIFIQPQQPQAKVLSRVITSPKHVKRLQMMLNNAVEKFEQKFGKIEINQQEISANDIKIFH